MSPALTRIEKQEGAALFLALCGAAPELSAEIDQRILALQTWGFLAPFVWGFSARWLPVSAICEMAAVTAFAVNLLVTFTRPRRTSGA
jgi:tRNA U34 5-methylaminomethyl-2-thiouridine-forming methyltransferase MnmC